MERLVAEAGNRSGQRAGGAVFSTVRVLAPTLRIPARWILAVALLGPAAAVPPTSAAELDLVAGVLTYDDFGGVANMLDVSLAGNVYTIDDAAESAINLSGNALSQGCTPVDTNTVTCPAAAVASFLIQTRLGADSVVLTGAAHPAVVVTGDGDDTFLGGDLDDVFVWNPGDDNDTVDGGPGSDTVELNGSNANETFSITADGAGFDVHRDVANVHLEVENAETLELMTSGGTDIVGTTGLVDTTQVIVDANDGQADVLTFDAAGLCAFLDVDVFEVVGRQPVQFSGFPSAFAINSVCGATLDLSAGVLSYNSVSSAANALDVSLAAGTYTIQDAGEIVSPTPGAVGQGCTPVDANTVTCPAAAVASFLIQTRLGADSVVLTGAAHPAVVVTGDGDDTFLGGDLDDVFVWNPGDDNDTVDGGPGSDTVELNGSNANETFSITADGAGFDVHRDVANVHLEVENAETLELMTLGGTDTVSTTSLVATTQFLVAGNDASPDTLIVDAAGLCLKQDADTFEGEGRPPIHFADFEAVFLHDAFCPCDGAVASQGCRVNGVRNQPCQGTPGDDVIVGTSAADVILGGGGHDRIRARAGDDVVCGEDGDDTLVGGPGEDTISGGSGDDRLRGGRGNDLLLGGDGADDLKGGNDDDDLIGGPGDDRLGGGRGLDTLRGGSDVDQLDGGRQEDVCTDTDQLGPFKHCELP